MASVRLKFKATYETRRFDGNKEASQHFADYEREIIISEANAKLLIAALEGAIDAADGSV
jgi:hypothetical protein